MLKWALPVYFFLWSSFKTTLFLRHKKKKPLFLITRKCVKVSKKYTTTNKQCVRQTENERFHYLCLKIGVVLNHSARVTCSTELLLLLLEFDGQTAVGQSSIARCCCCCCLLFLLVRIPGGRKLGINYCFLLYQCVLFESLIVHLLSR